MCSSDLTDAIAALREAGKPANSLFTDQALIEAINAADLATDIYTNAVNDANHAEHAKAAAHAHFHDALETYTETNTPEARAATIAARTSARQADAAAIAATQAARNAAQAVRDALNTVRTQAQALSERAGLSNPDAGPTASAVVTAADKALNLLPM